MRRLLLWFGLVAGSLVLVSCSGPRVPEPALDGVPVVVDASELVLPLDAFSYTEDANLTVQLAAWHLIDLCVERFGGEYTVSRELAIAVAREPYQFVGNSRRYGLFDAKSASTHGYNVPREFLASGGKDRWDPNADEQALVNGTGGLKPTDRHGQPFPEGGCIGEANRILAEGVP